MFDGTHKGIVGDRKIDRFWNCRRRPSPSSTTSRCYSQQQQQQSHIIPVQRMTLSPNGPILSSACLSTTNDTICENVNLLLLGEYNNINGNCRKVRCSMSLEFTNGKFVLPSSHWRSIDRQANIPTLGADDQGASHRMVEENLMLGVSKSTIMDEFPNLHSF